MAGNWSRRALLASIGTVAVAGCSSIGDPADTSATPTNTLTETATETPTDPAQLPDPEQPSSVDSTWPVPDADPGRSRGRTASAGPTDPIGELWNVDVGATLSSPVLASETVYVGGDDGVVRAYDARTGSRLWRTSAGAPAAAPWVLDETAYVPTADGIVALATDDGSQDWRVDTPSRLEFLVAPHGVYWLREGSPAVAFGLHRSDGSRRWRTEIDRCSRAPPLSFAGPDAVYVSSGSYFHQPWALSADAGEVRQEAGSCGADFAGERFYRDGTIYATDAFFGRIEATPVESGVEGWNTGVPSGRHVLCGGADRVYVDVNGGPEPGLFALDVGDGTTDWSVEGDWTAVSRPVVASETLLVNGEDALRCFDPTDGRERWAVAGDRIGDRVVVADDLVYTTDGTTVRAFRSVDVET